MHYYEYDYFEQPIFVRSVNNIKDDISHLNDMMIKTVSKLEILREAKKKIENVSTPYAETIECRMDELLTDIEKLKDRLFDMKTELSETLVFLNGG